jgi:thiol-disulfide isomerase/thioredoxin
MGRGSHLQLSLVGSLKRLIVVSLLVLVAAVAYRSFGSAETATGTLTLQQPAPNVGQRAPEFTTRTAEGDRFTLSGDGVYVLTFWSTLNESSNKAQPSFSELANEYGNDEVSFAAVYVNGVPDVGSAPYAMLQDGNGKLTSRYNVKRVPRLFLIENGTVKLVLNGYYDGSEEELKKKLQEVLPDGP